MLTVESMFAEWMNDPASDVMIVSGQAGTGKTTSLHQLDQYCVEHNINHHICAFTHKAVSVLKSKIEREDARITTLHSFLKKKPSVDESSTHQRNVMKNVSFGAIDQETELVIIDEFSMITLEEMNDINEYIKDSSYKLKKCLLIGDPNQLNPVKGQGLTIPENYKYHFKLTKIWRQADTNPLINTLTGYVKMIESKSYTMTDEIKELFKPHDHLIKNSNLIQEYVKSLKEGRDSVILAYSNRTVQRLNEEAQELFPVDHVWNSTMRTTMLPRSVKDADSIVSVNIPFGRPPVLNYETIDEETGIAKRNWNFYNLIDLHYKYDKIKLREFLMPDGEVHTYFYVFGHQTYKELSELILNEAVEMNKKIERQFDMNPLDWAKQNRGHPLNNERIAKWKEYYTFANVLCIDYPHAITIHKSQGSTWEDVFVAHRELFEIFKNKRTPDMEYARLAYVAMSRASNKVYTD